MNPLLRRSALALICALFSACTGTIYDESLLDPTPISTGHVLDESLSFRLSQLEPHDLKVYVKPHALLDLTKVVAPASGAWWPVRSKGVIVPQYKDANVYILPVAKSDAAAYAAATADPAAKKDLMAMAQCQARPSDGKVVLMDAQLQDPKTPWSESNPKRIHVYVECFWSAALAGWNFDLVRVTLIHELGHAIGLPHLLRDIPLDQSENPATTLYGVGVMNPFVDMSVQAPTTADATLYVCVYGDCGLTLPPEPVMPKVMTADAPMFEACAVSLKTDGKR